MFSMVTFYTYVALIPLSFLEGPMLATLCGYLSRLGYLNVCIVIATLVSADVLSDLFYYFLGKTSQKEGRAKKFVERALSGKREFFASLWKKRSLSMMFFGKLAYGISVPIIISAGIVGMPLKKFLAYSIPVSIFQSSLLVLIGYALGQAYYSAVEYVRYPLFIMGAVFTFVFILLYVLKVKTKSVLLEQD